MSAPALRAAIGLRVPVDDSLETIVRAPTPDLIDGQRVRVGD